MENEDVSTTVAILTHQGRWVELEKFVLAPLLTEWMHGRVTHTVVKDLVQFVLSVLRESRADTNHAAQRKFLGSALGNWVMAYNYPAPASENQLMLATHLFLDNTLDVGCRAEDAELLLVVPYSLLILDLIKKEFASYVSNLVFHLTQVYRDYISIYDIEPLVRFAADNHSTYILYALLDLGPAFAGIMEKPLSRVLAEDSERTTDELLAEGYPDIDRLLGPANNFMKQGPYNRCSRYGCRMLSCLCKGMPYRGSDEDMPLDTLTPGFTPVWYSGACDYCMTRIPRASWAVRRPVIDGGWIGTYCSWECVRRDPYTDEVDSMTLFLIKGAERNALVVSSANGPEASLVFEDRGRLD